MQSSYLATALASCHTICVIGSFVTIAATAVLYSSILNSDQHYEALGDAWCHLLCVKGSATSLISVGIDDPDLIVEDFAYNVSLGTPGCEGKMSLSASPVVFEEYDRSATLGIICFIIFKSFCVIRVWSYWSADFAKPISQNAETTDSGFAAR
jgi:hypothetical protein